MLPKQILNFSNWHKKQCPWDVTSDHWTTGSERILTWSGSCWLSVHVIHDVRSLVSTTFGTGPENFQYGWTSLKMANNKTRLSFPFQNAQPLLQILPQHTGLTTLAEAVSLLIGHGEEEDIFCVSTVPEILRFCECKCQSYRLWNEWLSLEGSDLMWCRKEEQRLMSFSSIVI